MQSMKKHDAKESSPPYDGSEEELIPFLIHLHIRQQEKGWAPATFMDMDNKKYDLTVELLKSQKKTSLQSLNHDPLGTHN